MRSHANNTRIEQWKALLDLQNDKRTVYSGVANWNIKHLQELIDQNLKLPDSNQIELHPWAQQPELVEFLESNNVHIIAYSSLVPLSTWRNKDGENSLKTKELEEEATRATNVRNYEGVITTATIKGVGMNQRTRGAQLRLARRKYE